MCTDDALEMIGLITLLVCPCLKVKVENAKLRFFFVQNDGNNFRLVNSFMQYLDFLYVVLNFRMQCYSHKASAIVLIQIVFSNNGFLYIWINYIIKSVQRLIVVTLIFRHEAAGTLVSRITRNR